MAPDSIEPNDPVNDPGPRLGLAQAESDPIAQVAAICVSI